MPINAKTYRLIINDDDELTTITIILKLKDDELTTITIIIFPIATINNLTAISLTITISFKQPQ